MDEFNAVIIENQEIKTGIYNLRIEVESNFNAIPGQFINIYLDRPDMVLPRPISICDAEKNNIRLLYQIVGKGTDYLAKMKCGERIRAAGPLGNGFNIQQEGNGKVLLIGGGIGAPPLLFLAKTLKSAQAVLGFRSASAAILTDEFTSLGCETVIATDDGSLGYKGNAMDAANSLINNKDISMNDNRGISIIYACGPRIMLRMIAEYASANDIPCQISMEEHMGCGIGACSCCPVPVIENGRQAYKKLCKDGPVFSASSIVWEGIS